MLISKCLISYAQSHHQQVKEVVPDPNSENPVGHSLKPGDWIHWMSLGKDNPPVTLKGTLPSAAPNH